MLTGIHAGNNSAYAAAARWLMQVKSLYGRPLDNARDADFRMLFKDMDYQERKDVKNKQNKNLVQSHLAIIQHKHNSTTASQMHEPSDQAIEPIAGEKIPDRKQPADQAIEQEKKKPADLVIEPESKAPSDQKIEPERKKPEDQAIEPQKKEPQDQAIEPIRPDPKDEAIEPDESDSK